MKKRAKIEICEDWKGDPDHFAWWRMVGANGRIICHSEVFYHRRNAIRAAKRAIVLMRDKDLRIVE